MGRGGRDTELPDKNKRTDRSSNLIESFDYALKGLIYAIKTERNMRIHVISAILVLLVSLFLRLSRMELAVLILVIALVLVTEILNTASELLVNMVTEKHHPIAKIIKDLSAGAVFFSSICALVIGYLLLVKRETLEVIGESLVIEKITEYPPHTAAAVVFLVIFVSMAIKALKEKKPAIEGGMPSIHTAVAFALATIVLIVSANAYVFILALILAAMVAQARVSGKIHTVWEVIAGALLGAAVTLLVFQLAL